MKAVVRHQYSDTPQVDCLWVKVNGLIFIVSTKAVVQFLFCTPIHKQQTFTCKKYENYLIFAAVVQLTRIGIISTVCKTTKTRYQGN